MIHWTRWKHRLPRPLRRRLKRVYTRLWCRLHRKEIAGWRRTLQGILAGHPGAGDPILFLPTVSWHIHLFQRPQQLAMAFARQGRLVFYGEVAYRSKSPPGFRPWSKGLYIARVPMEVFARAGMRPILYVLAYNAGYLDLFPRARILYEYIDELEVFTDYPLDELTYQHERLLRTADVVSATAMNLHERVRTLRPDAVLAPNAVDYAFFRRGLETTAEPPQDLAEWLQPGRPVVGYYGALAQWFDFELLTDVARRLPGWQFVLIGPDYDGSAARLKRDPLPNVVWLGPRPYERIPSYAKYMDVLTIPFRLNPVTHATSPLKLFEYMCARKPIVTTPMRESARYPVVLTAATADEFVAALHRARELAQDPEYLDRLDRTARENTWDARAQRLLQALERAASAVAIPETRAPGFP